MRVAYQHRRTTSWKVFTTYVTIVMRNRYSSYIVCCSHTAVGILTLFRWRNLLCHQDRLQQSPVMIHLQQLGTSRQLKVPHLLRQVDVMKAQLPRWPSLQMMKNRALVKLLTLKVEKVSSLKGMLDLCITITWHDSMTENEHLLMIKLTKKDYSHYDPHTPNPICFIIIGICHFVIFLDDLFQTVGCFLCTWCK